MAIYSRAADGAVERGLIRSASVTFQFTADDLRRVARHLLARADELEAARFVNGGRHLIDSDQDWAADHPECDVIVVPPDSMTR